jgi:hypothetical protein
MGAGHPSIPPLMTNLMFDTACRRAAGEAFMGIRTLFCGTGLTTTDQAVNVPGFDPSALRATSFGPEPSIKCRSISSVIVRKADTANLASMIISETRTVV